MDRKSKNTDPSIIKVKLDITTLNKLIAFIYKDSVLRTRKTLSNIEKIVTHLDMDMYKAYPDLEARVWIIAKTLDVKLHNGIDDNEYIKTICKQDVNCDEYRENIIDTLDSIKVTHEESKYLIKRIDDILQYAYIIPLKDEVNDLMEKISDDDFKSYNQVSNELYAVANKIITMKRKTQSLGSDQTFSLVDDTFESTIEDSVQRLRDRNKILVTGIQRWNTILAPGYLSKRLYTYLAFPGKGKSTILLKSMLDMRKYNKGIKTKDPDKRPAILFLTLENDIPETIERIYNMAVDSDDIRNYTPKQIIKKMREKGKFKLTDDNNIDIIIKEYKNRELDTNDLYTIIQDLEDDGVEVISLIVDYLKRIRSAEKAKDEKEELKNITNELKELAKFFDISVISAQQLNRTGATVVDSALQHNKEDVTKLVGRDSVATAWEIIENSDFVCIINPEVKSDTGELYLVFKMLKRRYRSSEESEKLRRLDYFAHPFEVGNEINLIDDADLPKPISLESLTTQFSPVETGNSMKKNKVERENRDDDTKKKKKKYTEDDNEYDPFDLGNSMNF